ncbi:MAG: hypothetical protein DIU70_007240 [Bacillota bacterium]
MREVEELLRLDRCAPIPEPPDPSYTAAVVARRLGRPVASASRRPSDWLPLAAGAAVGVGVAAVAALVGGSPYWLAAPGVLLIPLVPVLRKGVS